MINLQTLLSAFDEKGTLLKWLKKVEAALANATLENVQIVVVDETHIKMKFVFADGTFVESPSITLPRGPQGEAGIVSLESLIALLEGSEFISVVLNEQSTKVRIELDMTNVDNVPTVNSGNLVKSGGVFNALAEKLEANKNAVATVGGLVKPNTAPTSLEIVGIDEANEQQRVVLSSDFEVTHNVINLKRPYNPFYLHTIKTSAYTFYIVNKDPTKYSGSSPQMSGFLLKIASSKWIGTQPSNTFFAYDMEIAIADEFGGVTAYKRSPNIIQKGNAISYYGKDGQEVTILANNFGTFESDTVSEIQGF